VHKVELLRVLARGRFGDPETSAPDAALLLGSLAASEARAAVLAARRLLERRPECGVLWWVAARVLAAVDPEREARRVAWLLEHDPTEERLDAALEHSGLVGRPVVLEALALGTQGALVAPPGRRAWEAAGLEGHPRWLVVREGRALPAGLFAEVARLAGADVQPAAGPSGSTRGTTAELARVEAGEPGRVGIVDDVEEQAEERNAVAVEALEAGARHARAPHPAGRRAELVPFEACAEADLVVAPMRQGTLAGLLARARRCPQPAALRGGWLGSFGPARYRRA
jgi:hypothetical protein